MGGKMSFKPIWIAAVPLFGLVGLISILIDQSILGDSVFSLNLFVFLGIFVFGMIILSQKWFWHIHFEGNVLTYTRFSLLSSDLSVRARERVLASSKIRRIWMDRHFLHLEIGQRKRRIRLYVGALSYRNQKKLRIYLEQFSQHLSNQ